MARLSDEFRESLELAAMAYAIALWDDSQALDYLRGRGISGSLAEGYRLGVVDGSVAEHASYKGWVSIPYITRLAGVVSLKFRRLDGESPKYISPYPARIYNTPAMDRAEQLGYVAITEGEFDAIILDGLCGIPAVGIPGVETWKAHPEWAELFRGFGKVLVFQDQDEAGERLAAQITRELDTARIVSLPAKDVNQTYLDWGVNGIKDAAGV